MIDISDVISSQLSGEYQPKLPTLYTMEPILGHKPYQEMDGSDRYRYHKELNRVVRRYIHGGESTNAINLMLIMENTNLYELHLKKQKKIDADRELNLSLEHHKQLVKKWKSLHRNLLNQGYALPSNKDDSYYQLYQEHERLKVELEMEKQQRWQVMRENRKLRGDTTFNVE